MLRIYKPPIQNETEFLLQVSSAFAFCYRGHENIIIIRNFKMTLKKHQLNGFIQIVAFSRLLKKSI